MQEELHRLYANTTPFSIKDVSVHGLSIHQRTGTSSHGQRGTILITNHGEFKDEDTLSWLLGSEEEKTQSWPWIHPLTSVYITT
jgi:hypothetical protein